MSRLLRLAFLLPLLTACLPAPQAFDPSRPPSASNLGPNNVTTEWWYLSGYLKESGAAFHWAQFKVNYQGLPYYASHVAAADLKANTLSFTEQGDQSASFAYPPLALRQGDWRFDEAAGVYRLKAGPLDLTLTPQRPAVVHPPGYSGTPEVGQLYYVSITRLALSGTIAGKPVSGTAWFDHQWGDQIPGRQALWDWFGLHLSDGHDLMVYRVRDGSGKVVQLAASEVSADGSARAVAVKSMTPNRRWTGPSGVAYDLDWTVSTEAGDLTLKAVRDDQELRSKTTAIAYWEGPVEGTGTWNGQPVTAEGMGEYVGKSLGRPPLP